MLSVKEFLHKVRGESKLCRQTVKRCRGSKVYYPVKLCNSEVSEVCRQDIVRIDSIRQNGSYNYIQSRYIVENAESGRWQLETNQDRIKCEKTGQRLMEENVMLLNVIDKTRQYGVHFVAENTYSKNLSHRLREQYKFDNNGYAGGFCACTKMTSIRDKTKLYVLSCSGPKGKGTTYKHGLTNFNQVALPAYECKVRKVRIDGSTLNKTEIIEKNKCAVESAFVNVNMCKGVEEMLYFKQLMAAYDGQIEPLGGDHYLSSAAATVVDPMTSVRNDESFSQLNALNLITKENFHANKKVVIIASYHQSSEAEDVIDMSGDRNQQKKKKRKIKNRSGSSRNNKKRKFFHEDDYDTDDDDLLEMQFYDRNVVNISGQNTEYIVSHVMPDLVNGMMLTHKRGESRIDLDLFMANMKAELSLYMGTMIPAALNYVIEYMARDLRTHLMTHEQQMKLYRELGPGLLQLLSPSRENKAQCAEFSFGRLLGRLFDQPDHKIVTLKYKNEFIEENFINASCMKENDPRRIDDYGKSWDTNLPIPEEKIKYFCKSVTGQKRMQSIGRFWFDGSLRFRKYFDLDLDIPDRRER